MPLQRDSGTGSLLLADGTSLANECCCALAPCSCPAWWPGPGPAPYPQIQAASLAAFPNCITCQQRTVEPAWDGIIPLITDCDGQTASFAFHLNDNLIDAIFVLITTPPCKWRITITCDTGIFWEYEKLTGTDPFGTYSLTGASTACAGAPATIDVQPV